MIKIVNMVPKDQSGETNQDSGPNLAVNPANPLQIAGSAFTPGSPGGNAPIYVSSDGGTTWTLDPVVPAPGGTALTFDITLRFAGASNDLYASTIRDDSPIPSSTIVNVLRTGSLSSSATMTALETRNHLDQPFVQATTVVNGPDAGKDRVYVGNNDLSEPNGRTASLDVSLDAAAAAPSFTTIHLEARPSALTPFGNRQDGPQVRPAVHPDGTVYAVFYGWRNFDLSGLVTSDVVIVRDDYWGASPAPFTSLTDRSDGLNGVRVVSGIQYRWDDYLGQERIDGDLSIAIDPRNSSNVYLAWADHPAAGYSLHVCRSADRGATWSPDLLTIVNATNPAVALNGDGHIGLLYQQLTGTAGSESWETHLQLSVDGIAWQDLRLATVPASTPASTFDPYLGDYEHLMAVGSDFYGIFCANNTPDRANFPQGVSYQRNNDFDKAALLDVDNVTPVAISIDPFFFRFSRDTPQIIWPQPADINFGTKLTGGPGGQLNATVSPPLPGNLTYNYQVGDILPVGTHDLRVTFTPADTLNYNIATAAVQINVRTGHPVILSVKFDPTTLQQGQVVTVTVDVKNDSVFAQPTEGPEPGFQYTEGDTYLTGAHGDREGWPSIPEVYRIAVDTDLIPSPYTQRYLYRWGFGHELQPSEEVTVTGRIQFKNSREDASYYVAMIKEGSGDKDYIVVQDRQGVTTINVKRP